MSADEAPQYMQTFAGFDRFDASGVPVLALRDPRFKTFRVAFYMRRPLDDTAAARSMLPSLLLRGTETAPDRPALARRMQDLYGAVVQPYSSKVGESHVLCFALDAVAGRNLPGRPDQLGDGLAVLSELSSRPRLDGDGFPADVFQLERDQTANAIRTLIDDKGSYAAERALMAACHGEPMAIPEHGGLEAVLAMDRRDPLRALRDFTTKGQTWAIAMGDLPETRELESAIAGFCSSLPTRAEEPIGIPADLAPREPRRTVEHAELRQSKLIMVFRAPRLVDAELRVGRALFISVFGGGPSSRLFAEVREKRSLAYYASASLDRHKGLMIVQVGLDGDAVDEASAAIEGELAKLQNGEFDDRELETARHTMLAGLSTVDDSIQQRARFTNEQWLQDVDRTPTQVAALVQNAAPKHLIEGARGIWLDHSFVLTDSEQVAER